MELLWELVKAGFFTALGGFIMWAIKVRKAINNLKKSEEDLKESRLKVKEAENRIKDREEIIRVKKEIEKFIPQMIKYYEKKRIGLHTQLQIYRIELDGLLQYERMEIKDGVWKFLTESYDGIVWREEPFEGYYLLPQTKL